MRELYSILLTLTLLLMAHISDSIWFELGAFSFENFSNPLIKFPATANGDEILLVPHNDEIEPPDGIYKYNIKREEWINLYETVNFETSSYSQIVNTNTQGAYCILTNEHLSSLNLTKGPFELKIVENFYDDEFEGAGFIYFKNQLHLILGSNNRHHVIYDMQNNKLQTIFDFGHELEGFALVADKEHLSVMGGRSCKDEYSDKIHKYNHVDNMWHEIDLRLPEPMSHFGYVQIDQNNLILFGGENAAGITDNIFIHNQTLGWCLSDYKLPESDTYSCVLVPNKTKNECLSFGFINREFNYGNTNLVCPPFYIKQLISVYNCRLEYVYTIGSEGQAYKIHVHHLLETFDQQPKYYSGETTAEIKKFGLVSLNYKKRYLQTNRHRFYGKWHSSCVEKSTEYVGRYYICNKCGKVSDEYAAHYNHLTTQHYTAKFTIKQLECARKKENAISGEYIIYRHEPTDDSTKPYKCCVCNKRYSHSRTAMKHAKDTHTHLYNRLL